MRRPFPSRVLRSIGLLSALPFLTSFGADPRLSAHVDAVTPHDATAEGEVASGLSLEGDTALVDLANQSSIASAALEPASAFELRDVAGLSLGRASTCLAEAIYYEAGQETADGQRAVAQVVLNRVRHRAFPNTVCGVVYQGAERSTGCQFTFTCDGSLARRPIPFAMERARRIARISLGGGVYSPVGRATHYHADYVLPYWSRSLQRLGRVGSHIFYVWRGRNGTAAYFDRRYAGVEPMIAKEALIARRSERVTQGQAQTTLVAPLDTLEGADEAPIPAPSSRKIDYRPLPMERSAAPSETVDRTRATSSE